MTTADILQAVDPEAYKRAKRVEFAMRLLRTGSSRAEAEKLVRERFGISQPTAWRIVDIANDMAGTI